MFRLDYFIAAPIFLLLASCGSDDVSQSLPSTTDILTDVAFSESAADTPELGSFGVDLSQQDLSVEPGDDFFRYMHGRWLDEYELPPSRSNHGAPNEIVDRSDARVRLIIEELAASEPAAGSMARKIADYYLSYLDTERLDELGIEPLRETLTRIQQIKTKADLIQALGRSEIDTTASPIQFGVTIDRSNPDIYQVGVSVGGLGLPDRDYYLEDTEQFISTREEYVSHIARMLTFADIPDAAVKASAILQLETSIAQHLWPRDQRRNSDLTYNPMTYLDFKQEYPDFDWDSYFNAAGVDSFSDLNVYYPSAMSPIIELIDKTSIEDWKSYLSYQLISNNATVLSSAIDNENFHFYSTVLNGVPEQRERWERGVSRVGAINSLGESIGQIYVERYFPPEAKEEMEQLVENLRAALGESIDEIDWLGETTKQEARLKLESFRPKIAYPDEWKDLSAIEILRDDLFGNAKSVREFYYRDDLSRIGQKTNREEWGLTPQTVNAYYNSRFNEIVFPAAILQPPFFDPAADPAVNYGAIGSIIGHEMGHGFDDQGSKSDYRGIQRNWWTDEDRKRFDALTSALVEQYDQYEPVPGYKIDGSFTLGENIGDIGGLSIAYRAYKISLNGDEAPVIDGLTGDQRFFLAFAQLYRGKIRDDALIARLKSDPHSPSEFRTNGVVRNFDEWVEAFDVQPDDALYLPPEQRIRIW
jgi:putative endopeptidase